MSVFCLFEPILNAHFPVRYCEGFRMTAHHDCEPRAPGPSSESLQGTNPREVGASDAAIAMVI